MQLNGRPAVTAVLRPVVDYELESQSVGLQKYLWCYVLEDMMFKNLYYKKHKTHDWTGESDREGSIPAC